MKTKIILLVCGFLSASGAATSQHFPSQEVFGKNRVQYQKFEWKTLKTTNFEIFFYGNGLQTANLTAQYAESEFDKITELLSYTPYNRSKIFLYNSPQELTQSNMGMATYGGTNTDELDLAKSRIEIAFTSDQITFKKQIIKEITLLYVYDMMYGGNVKEQLQNGLLLSLPQWFMSGISQYVAEGWSAELDDYMRDYVQRDNKKVTMLSGKEATMVGHSIWNYIAERYGRDNISNILNLTRLIRSEQTSIASTLGVSYTRFIREWRDFYVNMGKVAEQNYKPLPTNWTLQIGNEHSRFASQTKLSLDNNWVAFTTSKDDRYTVEIANTTTPERTIVFKGKYHIKKRSYLPKFPQIAWAKDNTLAIVFEERGELKLRLFEVKEKGKTEFKLERVIRNIDQIESFDCSVDASMLAISGVSKGQNDLYLFNINRATLTQLTNDLYDDIAPRFVGSMSNNVTFLSNRIKDSLSINDKGNYKTIRDKFALFMHSGIPSSKAVERILELPAGSVIDAKTNDGNTFYALSDYKGISNIYKYEKDTKTLSTITNAIAGMSYADYNISTAALATITVAEEGQKLTFLSKTIAVGGELVPTLRAQSQHGLSPIAKVESKTNPVADKALIEKMANIRPKMVLDSGEVDTDDYKFDDDVVRLYTAQPRKGTATRPTSLLSTSRTRRRDNITIKGPFDYKGLFIPNESQSDIRIDPIRDLMLTGSIAMNDLLENHVLRAGGAASPINYRTNELWAEYQNLTYRVDFGAKVERNSLFLSDNNYNLKQRFNRFELTASYPLSTYSRISVSPFFAQSRLLDVNSVSAPDLASNYIGARTQAVFDNTKINGMNMMEGTRAKIRLDMVGGLGKTAGFNRVVIDARHYQKIHRDIIVAARFSGSHSWGKSPKKVAMGGIENWVNKRQDTRKTQGEDPLSLGFDDNGMLIDNRDIFFVEYAMNLRGFDINKVSGSSHFLMNAELRLPLVKYMYRGPITSNFLRNLQLVGFVDSGAAWTGASPFKRENSFNTRSDRKDFFSWTVNDFSSPLMLGYGVGARTMLFGMYVKFDYAWGMNNGEVGTPVPHLSLGYDF